MNGRKPRLKDVAALAGVSEKTVSNVLNDHRYISQPTRLKVEAALAELKYRVNPSARNLASGRTGFIALAVPGIDNPYFARLANHVIEAAAEHRWTVLIEQTGGVNTTETQVITGATSHLVDGIILHTEALKAEDVIARSESAPLVLAGERSLEHRVDHVVADNVLAARDLTQHLIESGRRRIASVGIEQSDFSASALRFEGVTAALRAAGLRPSAVISVERYDRRSGREIVPILLAAKPDAVVCFNDVVASGVLHGLLAAGVTVPDEVAVAGFDAIEETAFTTPPLTSVEWDIRDLARRSVELLADRAKGSEKPPQEVSVGHRLVIRRSTAPVTPEL